MSLKAKGEVNLKEAPHLTLIVLFCECNNVCDKPCVCLLSQKNTVLVLYVAILAYLFKGKSSSSVTSKPFHLELTFDLKS